MGTKQAPAWAALRLQKSRIDPVQHARKCDRLAEMIELADPRDDPLDPHAEPCVRESPELAEVQIPPEGFLGKVVFLDPSEQQIGIVDAHAAADDFSLAFGRRTESRRSRPVTG